MATVRPRLYLRTIFENNQYKVVDQCGAEVYGVRTIITKSPHDDLRTTQVTFIETNLDGLVIMGNGDVEKPSQPPKPPPLRVDQSWPRPPSWVEVTLIIAACAAAGWLIAIY